MVHGVFFGISLQVTCHLPQAEERPRRGRLTGSRSYAPTRLYQSTATANSLLVNHKISLRSESHHKLSTPRTVEELVSCWRIIGPHPQRLKNVKLVIRHTIRRRWPWNEVKSFLITLTPKMRRMKRRCRDNQAVPGTQKDVFYINIQILLWSYHTNCIANVQKLLITLSTFDYDSWYYVTILHPKWNQDHPLNRDALAPPGNPSPDLLAEAIKEKYELTFFAYSTSCGPYEDSFCIFSLPPPMHPMPAYPIAPSPGYCSWPPTTCLSPYLSRLQLYKPRWWLWKWWRFPPTNARWISRLHQNARKHDIPILWWIRCSNIRSPIYPSTSPTKNIHTAKNNPTTRIFTNPLSPTSTNDQPQPSSNNGLQRPQQMEKQLPNTVNGPWQGWN